MLLAKSFAVPVEPVVKPGEVITSEKPFFDPGAGTSQKSTGVSDVIVTSPSPVQATAEVPVMKASQPVEAAGTRRGVVIQQNATQPVEAAGAGTATQPVQAPGAGPEVLLTGTGNAALHIESTGGSDSKEDHQSELRSPVDGNFQDGSPDRDFTRDESADQELPEEASYRVTIRGMRSFMAWHQISEFDSVSSSDDNPFAGSRVQPTGKVSAKLPVDDWLCRKMEKLNLNITEDYPSRNAETAGLLRDQFVKPPRSSRWYDMHTDKKDSNRSTVCSWSSEPAKLNSAFSRVARRSLPAAPPSWALSQDI